MRATIRDVAQVAGVSVATVSRALNGADNVLPGTRQRILEAARALRFTPSVAARSLITRRTDTIGALLPDLHGEYFSELIRGIDQAARARGLHLLVSSSHGDAGEAAAALRAMHGRVDGLLLMSPHADADFLHDNLPAALPAVLLNTAASAGPGHARFGVDNLGGAQAMTRHLAAGGRRRVAFIGGPAGNEEARQRLAGYRAALRAGQRELLFDGDFSEDAGREAGRRIAALRQRPRAVFAANDMMAIGCIAALQEAGLSVPDDVAVGGFDDIPIARHLTPKLSTIRVPIAALGSAALEALAQAVEGPAPSPHVAAAAAPAVVMPVALCWRQSCGIAWPAAAAGRREIQQPIPSETPTDGTRRLT